jgi:uncharacterized protein
MSTGDAPAGRARDVLWQAWDEPGLEHLTLHSDADGVWADGVMLGLHGTRRVRVRYLIRCDAAWRAREVRVEADALPARVLDLVSDGAGRWQFRGGETIPALNDCLDVDLYASAFTNTLPIRRLQLDPGEAAEIRAAYIALPGLELAPARQRYTLLTRNTAESRWRYEGLGTDFVEEIRVDGEGLVLEYPRVGRRLLTA